MLIENVETASKLKKEIEESQAIISRWERAYEYAGGPTVCIRYGHKDRSGSDYNNTRIVVPFNILKTLTLEALRTELKEYETQLANLK